MITKPGDIALIEHNGQPVGYCRVEDIIADVKPGWWQITLMLLELPVRKITWILKDEYIDGQEFTMGGEPVRLQRLPDPAPLPPPEALTPPESGDTPGKGKVVSLFDHKKSK